MTLIDHIAVVVPAADEEELIGPCLAALSVARREFHRTRPLVGVDLIVVLDHCRDHTGALARRVAGVHTVDVIGRNVGLARDVGFCTALARTGIAPTRMWTAHTDADSRVPIDWLTGQLDRADAGAELVLGTVEPNCDTAALAQWRASNRGGEGHPHVHGANLGIRADVLGHLGGWPQVEHDEDVLLVTAAEAAGFRIDRAGDLVVTTSARRTARAPHGFAGYLQAADVSSDDGSLTAG